MDECFNTKILYNILYYLSLDDLFNWRYINQNLTDNYIYHHYDLTMKNDYGRVDIPKIYTKLITDMDINVSNLDWITHLEFTGKYIENIDFHHFNHLTHITFNINFNRNVDGILPPNLIYLKFGYHYNQAISIFPKKLEILIFGCCFNQPLPNLPISLKHLEFDLMSGFNYFLTLPPNLEFLKLGYFYNQPINLNEKLKHLEFGHGHKFNQPIILNNDLTFCRFGNSFNQQIIFNSNLTILKLGINFQQKLDHLPLTIINLTISSKYSLKDTIPSKLLNVINYI